MFENTTNRQYLLVALVLVATLGGSAWMLATPSQAIPVGTTIATGDSMGNDQPQLQLYHDRAIEQGDVIIFETDNGYISHRAVEATDEGWLTKGDPAEYVDQMGGMYDTVSQSNTAGVVVLSLPLYSLLAGLSLLTLLWAGIEYRRRDNMRLEIPVTANQIVTVGIVCLLVVSIVPAGAVAGDTYDPPADTQPTYSVSNTAENTSTQTYDEYIYTAGYDSDLVRWGVTSSGLEKDWQNTSFSNGVVEMVAVGEDYVFAGDGGEIQAFHKSNGTHVWTYTLAQQNGREIEIGPDGTVYFAVFDSADDSGYIGGLDPSDGTELYNNSTGNGYTALEVTENRVIAAQEEDTINSMSHDLTTSDVFYNLSSTQRVLELEVGSNSDVYYTDYDGEVGRLDADTGGIVWSDTPDTNSREALSVSNNLYTGQGQNSFVSRETADGASNWSSSELNRVNTIELGTTGDRYSGTQGGNITRYDTDSQSEVFANYQADGTAVYSIATEAADQPAAQTVSGQATTQDGTPIENATVHITGVDYNNIQTSGAQTLDERAQELYQEARDPLPDVFDQSANIDSNVRNADGEYVLVNTYDECGDVDLQPQSPVVEPGGDPVCVSVWDASDEPGLLQGDDLTNQYPGQPVEGEVTFERLSPTGEVTDTYTFTTGGSRELNILGGSVMRDHEESVAMQNVAPGIYRISLQGSSHTQVRSIGDPQDLAQTMEDDLEDQAGQLTQRAQDIRENFNQSKFVSTEVTTNETGHYTAEVGSSVNMVAVEAYHTGGVNISAIDPTNFGLPSDAHPLTVARAWQDQSSYNGSIYLPSRPQEYEAPTSNANITLQEVSYTPHGNNSDYNDRLANVTAALENASQQIAELQQQVNASRGNLEETYQTLHDVAVNDDQTYTRAEELLQTARGDNAELDINASDATDAELWSRITVLEQAIQEQRNTISADTQSSTSTDTVSAIAQFGGELTEDQVDVIAHYSNGTSEPVPDEYISVDQTIGTAAPVQGSTEVTVNEYPLGDATSVQFEWLAARDGETATVRERVRNPTINADAPQVDSVRVSSLAPGPNERVTVELHPGEDSDFRELTSATVYAPDGTEVTTTAIENGRQTSFETNGQGTYTAQLTYTDIEGNNYTRTVRLQADDIDRDRPASVRAESGPTGVYALVADGLSDGGVSVTDGGDLSIAAGIPENADVPGEIHVYTNGVESDPSGDINVRVVRGENDEAVSERSRVLIHGQATPAENTYVYRNGRPVTVDGNQYGEVTHQSDQNLYSTYTDESGEVTITVNQPQTLTGKAYEPVKFQLRQFEVFGQPVPAMLKGLGGFGGLGLIGLFARRRRGDPL